MGFELPLCTAVALVLECYNLFSGVELSIRLFVLFFSIGMVASLVAKDSKSTRHQLFTIIMCPSGLLCKYDKELRTS